jgi:hypothetical protein
MWNRDGLATQQAGQFPLKLLSVLNGKYDWLTIDLNLDALDGHFRIPLLFLSR